MLVTSGSRGSEFLAARLPSLAEEVTRARAIRVWHQCAEEDRARLVGAYASAGVEATVVTEFGDVAAAYRWADLAVTRGGASTLSELAVAGVPALVVPLADAAENHQSVNARVFASVTGGQWIAERQWDQCRLTRWVATMLTDQAAWRAVADRSRHVARDEAASCIIGDCEELMRDRW